MTTQAEVKTLTSARKVILSSAHLSPPSAWIVSTSGGRVGLERVSWKRNVLWLAESGYLYANGHGDYTLTNEGERIRAEITAERGL